nr:hypothetical protein [Tanacetum cinerariifolium]
MLASSRQYQIQITTATNASYESTLAPLKVTPPIDKLTWRVDGAQVQVQVSTHDATQQSRYYRWGASETWEFTSAYKSDLEYRAGIIQNRITPIYTCWHTERNTSVKQASSASLSYDALTDIALLRLPIQAERFKIRYSVLVSQYAETAEEFAYYEVLRKNTEAVGTVNDPLPTQLTGNVHRLDNAAEPVLGFVSAHTVQQMRLFISRQDLPLRQNYDSDTPYQTCLTGREIFRNRPDSTFEYHYPTTRIFNNPKSIPISLIIYPSADDPLAVPIIQGYLGSFLRSLAGLAILCLGGCVEAYLPDVINAPSNYLVVDGFINGNGVTRVKLSRSTSIATNATPLPEKGASLSIIDNTGQRYA